MQANTSAAARSDQDEASEKPEPPLAHNATRAIHFLFFAVLIILICGAIAISSAVYFFTKNAEQKNFETQYEAGALKLIVAFHESVESKLGAMNNFANTFTSYALATNASFPFVTLPDYALRGADLRVSSGAYIVHWAPLVTDDTREEWEEYALNNRHIFKEELSTDVEFRERQDEAFHDLMEHDHRRKLQANQQIVNETLADDGSGFHLKIWNFGAIGPRGDQPEGTGDFLPVWQSSPINPTLQLINLDFSRTRVFNGALEVMQSSGDAILNKAAVPVPQGRDQLVANLERSQYRQDADTFLDDPISFLGYPVFDSFDTDKNMAGALLTPLYWRLVLGNALPSDLRGVIGVLHNTFNQTLSYRIDGSDVTFLGAGDFHDSEYDDYVYIENINHVKDSSSPATRSYTTISLNEEYGIYELRVYPSDDTVDTFTSTSPIAYSLLVGSALIVPTLCFLLFAHMVQRRQQFVMATALANAQRTVETERELNEYLSHEVRNPLSAAISACSFVSSSMNDPAALKVLADQEKMKQLRHDIKVVDSALTFINDFLRSMLDLHKSDEKKLQLRYAPVDISTCVLEPVCTMLTTHNSLFDVLVDCPKSLVIRADALRLKQIVLNLAVNSSKFVQKGFIRLSVKVSGDDLLIAVEDSGPGIPVEKRTDLFSKFQASLDILNQGTGLGLSLCYSLAKTMGGSLWLDESYDSGIAGSPGAKFVLQLKEAYGTQLQIEESAHLTIDAKDPDVGGLPEHHRVLFVDDDQMLRKLFARGVLKVAPAWTIKEASNGETAIRMAEEETFDLIFMDQYMASVEKQKLGTETIVELRKKGVTATICGLSANEMDDAFMTAGADFFLLKPIPCKKDELTKTLMLMTSTEATEITNDSV